MARAATAIGFGALRRRLLLPSALLLTAALAFAVFVRTTGATTWTGPGFSMFSTVDYTTTRSVHLELSVDGQTAPAVMGDAFGHGRTQLRDRPNTGDARAVLEQALATTWTLVDGRWEAAEDGGVSPDSASLRVVTANVSGDDAVARVLLREVMRR